MNRTQFVRGYPQRRFRSIETMMREVNHTRTEMHMSAPAGVHRTVQYTSYAELQDNNHAAPYVVCSGATQLIGGVAGAGNRVGVAAQDHLPNTLSMFYVSGGVEVPFNPEDEEQIGIIGKDAYYVAETGYFTADATGLGTNRIKVGTFQSDAFLPVGDYVNYPNGIMWVRVFLNQTYDNAMLPAPEAVNTCGCENTKCDLFAAPTAQTISGLTVSFNSNARNGNPLQSIGTYSWNFDGAVTNVGGVISFAAQSTEPNPTFTFPSAGSYSDVYLVISAQLPDGTCGCDIPQTPGESPCCKAYNLTVEVTATSATIVSCNTVDNSTLRTFNLLKIYRKADIGVTDTVAKVVFDISTTQSAVGNITTAGAAALKTAIENAITAAGFVFANVIVNVTPAAANGDDQSLSVIVINTNADLKGLEIDINGSPDTAVFTAV